MVLDATKRLNNYFVGLFWLGGNSLILKKGRRKKE